MTAIPVVHGFFSGLLQGIVLENLEMDSAS